MTNDDAWTVELPSSECPYLKDVQKNKKKFKVCWYGVLGDGLDCTREACPLCSKKEEI